MAEQTSALTQMLAKLTALQQEQGSLFRAQAEQQTQILSQLLVQGSGVGASTASGLEIPKLGPAEDPQTFIEVFENIATASGWPNTEWAMRLLPLLAGEAQAAARAVPPASQGSFLALKRAILDRTGMTPEDHRRQFRGIQWGPADDPFTFALQLREAAGRWLCPADREGEGRIVQLVVLEQFIAGLPVEMGDWVRCKRPEDLDTAVTLVEDFLARHGRSKSTEKPPEAPPKPVPAPRRECRVPGAPGALPAPQTQECWRCGQHGHFHKECQAMEVGEVIQIVRPPVPFPGPGGAYSVQMQNQNSGARGAEAPYFLRSGQWLTSRDPSVVNKIKISATQVYKLLNSGFMNGKSSTPPTSYIITDNPYQIKPLEWGNIMEAKARMTYQEKKMASLGRRISIVMSGLFDDPKWPWLCAKTDGIVTDDSGQWLCCLEVKCPYKHRHKRVVDACREDQRFCLEILDPNTEPPKYQLKKSHEYFTQVQVQMALTGIREVDFVVYTLKDIAITTVKFDSEHWQETVAKLETFIEKYNVNSTLKRSEEDH